MQRKYKCESKANKEQLRQRKDITTTNINNKNIFKREITKK